MTNKDFIKLLLISVGCDKKYEIEVHRASDGHYDGFSTRGRLGLLSPYARIVPHLYAGDLLHRDLVCHQPLLEISDQRGSALAS